MNELKITLNMKPMKGFLKNIKKPVGVKVGVLGSTDAREGEPITNAQVGLKNEFGSVSENIPARSFLRMPLETKEKELEQTFSQPDVKKMILKGDIKGAMTELGFTAEKIIDDAFKSRGFGSWKPNAPYTIAKKGSSEPLIDTSQLRRSITSKVVGLE